ncbi:LapD/MoxY N-terminal periplasmic domain-containing protein [Malikia sp.]|uniref:bifunctional diguanylate cyclase/phosphodiesterase n=1 Tax=Malikia sp. TaxID=2070706 RepID=UPI002630C16F|nr:LapD/MoxY N-terminal periplasmic domain-containing protein [Malikia sp.]MDD2727760.1 LapD/MoxY N-terminal periplasmic domain-containing protein [Malikia sp.]
MTLVKQIWLAIALIMAAAFGTSLAVNLYSTRHYLEQQLQVKNLDNATSIALSLSQMNKDPTTVGLLLAAQFDLGHYRFIRITSPNGQKLFEQTYSGDFGDVPPWFTRLFPIHTEPGQALIQDGWKQYGTLTLASHDQYAYQSLWDGMLELLRWFVLGCLVAGGIGTWLVRWFTRPLLEVVAQAQALAERRFQTVKEPRTSELRAVTRAMNDMVGRIKAMFTEEAQRLEVLRDRVNHDAVTGLSNRDHFLSQLREVLGGEQHGSSGSLIMLRLADLNALNKQLGHQRADQLLKSLGELLQADTQEGQRAGRLKGGKFALICPTQDSAAAAQALHARLLRDWLPQWQSEWHDLFHLAAVHYERHQGLADLLTRADQALARAQAKGRNNWYAPEASRTRIAIPAEQWRVLLTEAMAQTDRLSLALFPVLSCRDGWLLHHEGALRLQTDVASAPLSAGDFMWMAAKLNLTAPIDLGVVKLAIRGLRERSGKVAINLSADTIADFGFRNQLTELLQANPALCSRLLFEVPEYGVSRHFEAFQSLSHRLKSLGCQVGIEYFGKRFVESDKLASLGLDYIKVDPGYVRGIGGNAGNQEFLTGLCTMAQTLGMAVIAVGVEHAEDLALLSRLGFDGATGPGVQWNERS